MSRRFRFLDLEITESSEPIVIAEIGINHGGSLETAKLMVRAAIRAGARLIKHQTHIPDAEMSSEAREIKPGNADESIYKVISDATLKEDEEKELMDFTISLGGIFFSSPFSWKAAERLAKWDVPLFKIGSGECNNFPLLERIASLGKPVILSTGMNNLDDVKVAYEILVSGGSDVALLHTTNLYPTPQSLVRLGGIADLLDTFPDAIVGLSDHSKSNAAAIGAVALGAQILERHFTDTKQRVGPDIVCSMDESELKELIAMTKDVYQARGGSRKAAPEEKVTQNFAFASCVALVDIQPGDLFTLENTWVKRPGTGDFLARDLSMLIGKTSAIAVKANSQIPRKALK